ncbi:efflux RND transporter permease subunit, partial [Escherichia coli]|nr:efflux RND transporter permease subunit [Escherichia coli]
STHDPPEFSLPRGTLPDGTPEPAVHPAVRFSVRNYVFSIGIFLMVVLLGLIASTRLGVELLPNFEVPVLAVSTSYPGATPDQVDREVSQR